ncbi:MAG: hypothetical protein Q7J68_06755, partial [Thermoplasmata archaeon]|nr:hypothetical protein [Thermoplasmata archaeon]
AKGGLVNLINSNAIWDSRAQATLHYQQIYNLGANFRILNAYYCTYAENAQFFSDNGQDPSGIQA